jgi:MoaA/NifB/PqqE/SkfB family radical SAM enzyme
MCSFANGGDVFSNPKEHLPLEIWKNVVDDLAQYGCYISLTGGEPLLYPKIDELIRHIKERRLVCILTTNGTLLSQYASKLMENPPDVLIVSIDGPAEVHDELRGRKGTFDLAVQGITEINRLREKQNQNSPFLIINSAITSLNYRHSEEMIGIAEDLSVDALNFQHQWSLTAKMIEAHNLKHGAFHFIPLETTGQIDLPKPDSCEVVEVVRKIQMKARTSNSRMYIHFYPELGSKDIYTWYENPYSWVGKKPPVCAWITTDIMPNGDVEPCIGLVCGNITKQKFKDIWNNELFREHRRRLAAYKGLPICPRCCAVLRRD